MKPSRLTSITHFLFAAVFAAMGLIAYFSIKNEEAAKAAARGSKPPQAVLIENFRSPESPKGFEEVTLLAQMDVKKTIILLRDTKKSDADPDNLIAHVIPLYAVTAPARDGQPAYGSLIARRKISDNDIKAMFVSNGGFAPVVRINGKLETGVSNDGVDALKKGPRMIDGAVHIVGFMDGRAKALVAQDDAGGVLGSLLVFAAGFAGWGWWRRRRKFKKWAAEEADRRYGLPEWNER